VNGKVIHETGKLVVAAMKHEDEGSAAGGNG
jgi:hypothetical protein